MSDNAEFPDTPFPQSPVVPSLLEGGTPIQFRCHKAIACFNACCKNIDISLTPYDILRLKHRLGLTSTEFLTRYTMPYEMEKNGIAGVKLRPVENGTACQFMTEEGCGVYTDRPTACRYYPVALLSMRRQNEYTEREAYALVEEAHCLGHQEPRTITIDAYRQEQGLPEYDDAGRGWRQLILKKKSSGPTVGTPSKRSLQFFFMACYDLDRFRDFVASDAFADVYALDEALRTTVMNDEMQLMEFAFRLIRQIMFNEVTIPLKVDALEKRQARKQERDAVMAEIVAKVGPVEGTPLEDERYTCSNPDS
ncbi:MAG: YkgJ family cysteine cluster protein [Betaproteobacteria bacterium]|nr:YkgJ family cysteine cluster protein [Betaproteobacteria bacterium]